MKHCAFLPLPLILLLAICNLSCTVSSPESSSPGETFRVTRVIDGDTIEIEGGYRIRYIGIDTPEVEGPYTSLECFGEEASAKNRELVEGRKIRLESDVEDKDQYGRLLRYVYIGDLMVNAELLRLGYAHAVFYPPNVKHQNRFLEYEGQAREQDLGLWGKCK